MLTHLQVQNFAVLDEIELDLAPGFTALTGETGAGKSLLVDALALALGERADSAVVRQGASRSEVTAHFSMAGAPAVRPWLVAHDLDEGEDCQLRRIVTGEGRSRGYINGRAVPLDLLRELGALLVEICGQHEHQSLVRRPAQRELLDSFGGHDALLASVADAHTAWTAARAEFDELSRSQAERQDRVSLLSYQLQELTGLGLAAGEFEELEQERVVLANVERIAAGLGAALEVLYDADEGSAHSTVSAASRTVSELADIDPQLVDAAAELEEATSHLREAADQLRRRLGGLEHDPARLQSVETRLVHIAELARKHRTEAAYLWQLAPELQEELDRLTGTDQRLAALQPRLDSCRLAFEAAVDALHGARTAAAARLARSVNTHLRRLGMAAASLSVSIERLPFTAAGPVGADEIEFLVRTNADQAPGPIGRIASGGELSRLALALRLAALGNSGPSTLIFDEVDAGTGGGVAEIVGQSLSELARSRQVLCITHLPQVASLADQHCMVEKNTTSGATRTRIRSLESDARVEEVARMLGGLRITARAREHAREMLGAARKRQAG